jgi:putative membrane protein
MKQNPYSRFNSETLILRDELALDRTVLANERTLLAYLRSAVALLLAGVSIMEFSQQQWFWVIGVICLPVGIMTGLLGVVRFYRMKKNIAHIRNYEGSSLPPMD